MRGPLLRLHSGLSAIRAFALGRVLIALAALLLASGPPQRVLAQERGDSEESGGTGAPRPGVEEIMVIGEVLETSTQSESEAITTFDQAELDTLGIASIETLALNTPSLHVGQVGQQAVITLRGVGLENLTSIGEGGVGFQVDGVHLGRPSASNAIFFDLERADVIRGPVGTRGGRQTTGGRIELWSKRPDEDFDVSGDITVGNYDLVETRGIINLPIFEDKLLTRASLLYKEHRGYQDLALSGVNANDPGDADDFAGRGQLRSLWLDQSVELRAIGTHSTQKGNGPAVKLVGPPPSTINATVGALGSPALGFDLTPYLVDCPDPPLFLVDPRVCTTGDPWETFSEYDPFRDNEQNGITGIATWDMPYFADTPMSDLRLGAIASWQQNIEDGAIDFDGTNIPEQYFDQRRNTKQYSVEVHLERPDIGLWDFRTGVYFYKESIESTLCFDAEGHRTRPDLGYTGDIDTRSIAGYGELGARPFDNLRVFGGLRWTKDKKDADETIVSYSGLRPGADTSGFTVVPPGGCGRYFRDLVGESIVGPTIVEDTSIKGTDGEWQGVTPMVGFEWQVRDTSSLGLTVTRGFKPGGFPVAIPSDLDVGTIKEYDAEFVMEYELTSKNELFDGRLRLNVTGFWMEYDPFQICQFNGPSFFCRSDGSATIRGFEIEWRTNPIEGLQLNGHFNYIDSRINDFQIQDPTIRICLQVQTDCPSITSPPTPPNTAVTVDVSGNEQPKAPSYAGSLGIQYEFDLGARGFLVPRVQSQFQGTTFYRVFNRPEFSQDDFIKYDAKLTWRSENERYAVEIFGVNLTDEEVINSLFVGSTFSGGQVLGQYQPPRTYGAKLSINYAADWIEDLL